MLDRNKLGTVAQSGERLLEAQKVVGSIPTGTTSELKATSRCSGSGSTQARVISSRFLDV